MIGARVARAHVRRRDPAERRSLTYAGDAQPASSRRSVVFRISSSAVGSAAFEPCSISVEARPESVDTVKCCSSEAALPRQLRVGEDA